MVELINHINNAIGETEMKPHIKFDKSLGMWICGGLIVKPWYIDWFAGKTPFIAYEIWQRKHEA